jgi:hypothetical protein
VLDAASGGTVVSPEVAAMRFVFRLVSGLVSVALIGAIVVVAFATYVAAAVGALPFPALRDFVRPAPVNVPEIDLGAAHAVQQRIDAAARADTFALDLSAADLEALVAQYAAGPGAPLNRAQVSLGDGTLSFSGELPGRVPVPFSAAAAVRLVDGQAQLDLRDVTVGTFALPGPMADLVAPVVGQVANLNEALGGGTSTVVIERLSITPGGVSVAGERRSQRPAPQLAPGKAPGALPALTPDVPEGRIASGPGQPLVIAAGDSLAAATGASRPQLGFASRFHRYLEVQAGIQLGLQNLGVPGETTGTMIGGGQLARTVALLQQSKDRATGRPEVPAVLVSIGANDVNRVLVGPECQRDVAGAACQALVTASLERARQNLPEILGRLRAAAGPDVPIILLGYYNPFNLGTGLPFEQVSQRTVDQLNTIMREAAGPASAQVADGGAAIGDAAGALTQILHGDIHPTDDGYARLTGAIIDTWTAANR